MQHPVRGLPSNIRGADWKNFEPLHPGHRRAWQNTDVTLSAVAEHSIIAGHAIAWSETFVLDRSDKPFKKCVLEVWHIRSQPHPINWEHSRLLATYNGPIPRRC